MTDAERKAAVHLALGRIFLLLSRPYQPGDEAEFANARAVILEATDTVPEYREPAASVLMRHKARFGD